MATEYFQLVCGHTFGPTLKQSAEREIHYQRTSTFVHSCHRCHFNCLATLSHSLDMKVTHTLNRQRRTPCFPQIDLAFRAILHEHRPPFIILFSHQTTSYSQIFFTHPLFVPASSIYYDFPSGCPNPCCTEECEMVRFPRNGLEGAAVLPIKRGKGCRFGRVRAREHCNWIDCDTVFEEEGLVIGGGGGVEGGSESSQTSEDDPTMGVVGYGVRAKGVKAQVCSKCRVVKYCSAEHQRKDWEEHKRMCTRSVSA